MTRLDLRNLLLYWVDDLNAGYFTETQCNAWLNRALREVQKQLLDAHEYYYLKCVYTTTVVNQREYTLPLDFLCSHRLEYILSGSGVSEVVQSQAIMTLNQQDFFGKAAGTPGAYVVKKSSLVLFPAPDTATTLRFFYSHRIDDMNSDGDVPDVPEQYQEYIALLAAQNAFIKDDRVPNNLLEKIQEYKTMMKNAAEERQQDAPRTVIKSEFDDYGSIVY